jgi:hypothetical protein
MPPVVGPNLGLIFNKPAIDLPPTALQDGLNFRCKNGTLESLNLGWSKFSTRWKLNGAVKLIDNFSPRNQAEFLMFADTQDVYVYNPSDDSIRYLTPQIGGGGTGTISSTGTTVTLDPGYVNGFTTIAKPGDQIIEGTNFYNGVDTNWRTIVSITDASHLVIDSPFNSAPFTGKQYTIRSRFANIADVQWSSSQYMNDGATGDDLWFITNGVDNVMTWNGTTDPYLITHPELQFTCKYLVNFLNMMIYINITEGGVNRYASIINSDVGFPLRAGATGIQLSEEFVAHSHPDPLDSGFALANSLILYSPRTITIVQFVGAPVIFSFTQAEYGIGPLGPTAVADFGDFHEFIGHDNSYSFDGASLRECNTHVWREILKQTDPIRQRFSYTHLNEEQGDLIWSIPATTDPGAGTVSSPPAIAWSEHYLEVNYENYAPISPFSKRTFPFTATGFWQQSQNLLWQDATFEWQSYNFAWNDKFFSTAFPINLSGDVTGQIYQFDNIQTADGAQLPSFVRTGRQMLTSGRERSLLTRVYPFCQSYPGNFLEVTPYMTDAVGMTPISVGTQLLDLSFPQSGHFVSIYRRGRAMELVYGSSVGGPWSISGWDTDIVPGGRR